MKPVIFHLPFDMPLFGNDIKGYGFMLMIGFLSAIYWATRRAVRAQADPDLILNAGFIALVSGVAGARIFFVAHYWETQFANRQSPLWAALDCRQGGLEFYGGYLGALPCILAYLYYKRVSIRMYLDIIVPTLFWGLGVSRLGCFLNGCCWGGICVTAAGQPALPWAVQFPFGSPAHIRHWEEMRVTVPAELLMQDMYGDLTPVYRNYLELDPEELTEPRRQFAEASAAYEKAKNSGADNKRVAELSKAMQKIKTSLQKKEIAVAPITQLSSRFGTDMADTVGLTRLSESRSLPVHPTQVYSSIAAICLSIFLALLFRVRKRHGVVFGVCLLLYPIQRFVLELVRTDNPRDTLGLSISQAVSLGMFMVGVCFLLVIYRLPLRSPLAVPFDPRIYDKAPPKSKKRR